MYWICESVSLKYRKWKTFSWTWLYLKETDSIAFSKFPKSLEKATWSVCLSYVNKNNLIMYDSSSSFVHPELDIHIPKSFPSYPVLISLYRFLPAILLIPSIHHFCILTTFLEIAGHDCRICNGQYLYPWYFTATVLLWNGYIKITMNLKPTSII